MIPHPHFYGDFLAQSLDEVTKFNNYLDKLLIDKAEGKLVIEPTLYDTGNYIAYDMAAVKKYADEKISSANPIIYLSDLDDIMKVIGKCLLKYCILINKTERDVKASIFEKPYTDNPPYLFPLIRQVVFCLEFKEYYTKKRNLDNIELGKVAATDQGITQFHLDKDLVSKILDDGIKILNGEYLEIVVNRILNLKYSYVKISELPFITLGISQAKLIAILKRIRTELPLDKNGRVNLVDIIKHLPKARGVDGVYIYYNANTLYKNI